MKNKKNEIKRKLKQNDAILFTNFVKNFQFKANVADAKTELFLSYLLFCGCFDLIWLQWCVSVKKKLYFISNTPRSGTYITFQPLEIFFEYWIGIDVTSQIVAHLGSLFVFFSPEKGYVYGEHRTNERMDNIENARILYSDISTQFQNTQPFTIRRQPVIFFIYNFSIFVVRCCMCMCFKPISSTEARLFLVGCTRYERTTYRWIVKCAIHQTLHKLFMDCGGVFNTDHRPIHIICWIYICIAACHCCTMYNVHCTFCTCKCKIWKNWGNGL